jgi:hypothetical protein
LYSKKIKEIDQPEPPELPVLKNSELLSTILQTAEQSIKISKAWQQKLDILLSSPSRKNFNKYIEGQESLLTKSEYCIVDLNSIRTAFKQKEQAKEKARKYIVQKGPITAQSFKKAIIEKEARQAKAKAKKGGKAKGTFIIELSSELDCMELDNLDQKEEGEDPERVELAYGPPITDPFENQHNYISWK